MREVLRIDIDLDARMDALTWTGERDCREATMECARLIQLHHDID